jgi:hypothetical protein
MKAFCDVALCSLVKVDGRFRGNFVALMMEAVRTCQTPVYFSETTRRYISESCHFLMHDYLLVEFGDTDTTASQRLVMFGVC